MSLKFDTGLTRSMRELIVGAFATALADLRKPGKYLAGIVSMPRTAVGKNDEDFFGDLVRITNGRVPCIAIATGAAKSTPTSEDALEVEDEIEVGVYFVSANQRGHVDGRLFVDVGAANDDAKDPGVFAAMQHAFERLQGAELGVAGVKVPVKSHEDEVGTFDDVSVWCQLYTVAVDYEINPDRNATTVLTSIEAKHKGDGIPDATALDPMVDTVSPIEP